VKRREFITLLAVRGIRDDDKRSDRVL